MNCNALQTLKILADEMLQREVGDGGLAGVVRGDPEWTDMECTRRHVALMWTELNEAVTAEVGSALTRSLPSWDESCAPQIVVGEPEDFEEVYQADQPYGWSPLAKAHRREALWDFPPTQESGTWIGWWEPENGWPSEKGSTVTGVISAFIVVADADLKFAHTVMRRRRRGIASKLVEYATSHHGLEVARGPFTPDGEAFSRSRGLCP